MTRYTATIAHHSISRAPEIRVDGTLSDAKRVATRRFSGGFLDHEIRIYDAEESVVSRKRIGDRRWTDAAA